MTSLTDLQNDYNAIQSSVYALGVRVASLESGGDWYTSAIASPFHVASCSYRDQVEIDARSVKVSRNPSGTNENVVYDPVLDAAKIVISGSLQLWNRVNLILPKIETGEVVFQWEYLPSGQWLANGGDIFTHKMFMIGTTARRDNRLLEQRFHYEATVLPQWRCDTRDYGAASGNESLAIATNSARVDPEEWIKFESRIDLNPAVPTYTVKVKQRTSEFLLYDRFPLDALRSALLSIDFFSPTWINTSQVTAKPSRVHGWLRNAVALWNPIGLVSLN